MVRHAYLILIAAAIMSLSACGLTRAESPEIAFGRRIAERNCGGCHAIGAGQSPNPKSPPFRLLYRRYRHGDLDSLLVEGMLAPSNPPEEGSAPSHPWMPQAALGEDEIAALKAYLYSVEPPSWRRGPAR